MTTSSLKLSMSEPLHSHVRVIAGHQQICAKLISARDGPQFDVRSMPAGERSQRFIADSDLAPRIRARAKVTRSGRTCPSVSACTVLLSCGLHGRIPQLSISIIAHIKLMNCLNYVGYVASRVCPAQCPCTDDFICLHCFLEHDWIDPSALRTFLGSQTPAISDGDLSMHQNASLFHRQLLYGLSPREMSSGSRE